MNKQFNLCCTFGVIHNIGIQWGSEIRPFEIRKHLKSGLFEGQISNGLVLAINHSKTNVFDRFSNGFWQNGGHLSGFQIVGLPDFRSHLKSRPFATQPVLDHSKSRLGRISDPHCSPDFRSPLYYIWEHIFYCKS